MIATIAVILIFYGVMIALTLTVLPIAKRELFVGTIAAVLNTAMYAAPLSVMVTDLVLLDLRLVPDSFFLFPLIYVKDRFVSYYVCVRFEDQDPIVM